MSGIPSVNGLVEIVLGDGRTYRSRVEDASESQLTVAAPMGAGDLEMPEAGAILGLAWVEGRSRNRAPVRLVEVTRRRPVQWRIEVVGEVTSANRRQYVRGGGGEQIEIIRIGIPGKSTFAGRIIDLSEGGVRFGIDTGEFRPGDAVTVRFALRDVPIDTGGTVLYVRRPGHSGRGADVVVTYTLKEATAKEIRRYVFERELAERRRARNLAEADTDL